MMVRGELFSPSAQFFCNAARGFPEEPPTAGVPARRPPLAQDNHPMQKSVSKPVITLASASLFLAALAPVAPLPVGTACAQDPPAEVPQDTTRARRLEGVWDSQVTIVNPQTGATLRTVRALDMFSAGGAFTDTNNAPVVPLTRGSSFGRWEYLGGKRYAATIRNFRFNPDGTFAGTQRVSQAITLDPGAQGFTATLAIEVLDTGNNVIQTLAGTVVAARVE